MSTRRSFKGIAAIAALALGVLGFTAVPAHATGIPVNLIASATGLTPSGTIVSQVAGAGNFVNIGNTVISGGGALPVYFSVAGGTTTTNTTSGTLAAGASVQISTPTVGTITVLGYSIVAGTASTSVTDTITITVVGSAPGTVYASSTIYGAPGSFSPNISSDSIFSVSQPAGTANAANFSVAEVDSTGVAIVAANAKPISVSVSNGLISSPNLLSTAIGNTNYITGIPVNAVSNFYLSGLPNFGGVSTVTFSVNGVVLKTYSVKFIGTASRIVLTAINPVVGIGNSSAILSTSVVPTGITANTNALEVQEFDANGNALVINPSNISVVSSITGVATTGFFDIGGTFPLGDIAGGALTSNTALGISINGVSAGNTTFTAIDASHGLTSIPVSVRVSSGVPTSVVLKTNLAAYAPGQPGTLTTTLSDAVGILPAGTYVVFTGQAISSIAVTSGSPQLPGAPATITSPPAQLIGQVTINNSGSYTDAFNAPANPGPVTITGIAANSSIVVTPAAFTVTGDTASPDVAADAANESSDSATALADTTTAATASGDAADKPGVVAVALATATQAQITALTIVVTAVLNKAAALAKSVAAINKKIGKK